MLRSYFDLIRIKVEQKELKNGKILNQNELRKIGVEFFKDWDIKKHYVPLTYVPNFDSIGKDWIQERMEIYHLKKTDLVKQLAVDKGDLSAFLNGRKTVPKSFKVKAYYYFMTFQLNEDFRDALEAMSSSRKKESNNLESIRSLAEIIDVEFPDVFHKEVDKE